MQLNCGGQSIVGTNASVGVGGRLINTTFNLTTASPGTCDVVIAGPDGTSATLSKAFTVQQGGAPNIQIHLTGAAVREGGIDSTAPFHAFYFTTVQNMGNVDSGRGFVTEPVNPPLTLTSVTPAGIDDFAVLSADSTVVWNISSLPAGQSQWFTSTASTLQSVGPTLVAGACAAVAASDLAAPLFAVGIAGCAVQNLSEDGDIACEGALEACREAVAICKEESPFSGPCMFQLSECVKESLECEEYTVPSVIGCIEKFAAACVSSAVPVIAPRDPNSIIGPSGLGGQRWVSGPQSLTYGISFGNDPSATGPAQQVVVTQPLGPRVNLSSLGLLEITIPNGTSGANIAVQIPASAFNPVAGVSEFTTTVDLRPSQSLLVSVDAKLNTNTQTLTWTLGSIDPATGLPPLNPRVGFLPPGVGGNVAFTVKPVQGLATGAQISDQAAVVFNANAPVSTPAWVNTIDNTPPVSHVSALPQTSSCPDFRVAWSGSDIGSGLQGFTVYASDNGGPFAPWLSNTSSVTATYTGTVGHTYSLYSVASDLTGNLEPAKTSSEATTTVNASGTCGPPSLSGQVSSVSQSGTTVTVQVQLTNTGFSAAKMFNIGTVIARTLSGSGSVTLAGPALPAAEGPLAIGASTTVTLTLNVPATVTRFSLTESGSLQDAAGQTYNYSVAQTVIP